MERIPAASALALSLAFHNLLVRPQPTEAAASATELKHAGEKNLGLGGAELERWNKLLPPVDKFQAILFKICRTPLCRIEENLQFSTSLPATGALEALKDDESW